MIAIERGLTEWENGIKEFGYSLFLSPKWVEAMADSTCKPIYIDFDENGIVVAKISGLVIDGGWLKGSQLYFYSGPAMRTPDSAMFQDCLKSLWEFAVGCNYSRISIRPWDQLHSYEPAVKGYNPTSTHEYEIDLLKQYDDKTISSRILRNVKKARKINASVQQSTELRYLDLLMSFLDETKSRRVSKFGIEYSPFYLFNLERKSIAKLVQSGLARFYIAMDGEQVQSVLLMIDDGKRAYNLLKGSFHTAYVNGVSSFADFEVVHHYSLDGHAVFNLGVELANQEGEGLNSYKAGMGGEKIFKHGAYTYYLIYPYKILNLFFYINSSVPDFKWIMAIRRKLSMLFSGAKN
ncbi:MAG: hypothetical protein QM786_14735 [Breznakibacter sp.]